MGTIRTQSRESRNPEKGSGVKIGFLNADEVERMGRKKVEFSAPGSKTSSIPLKNPERVRGEWRQEAQKKNQEQLTVEEGQREKI